jgi:hypothetical protein
MSSNPTPRQFQFVPDELRIHHRVCKGLQAMFRFRELATLQSREVPIVLADGIQLLFDLRSMNSQVQDRKFLEPHYRADSAHGDAVEAVNSFLERIQETIVEYRSSTVAPIEGWQTQNDIFLARFRSQFFEGTVEFLDTTYAGADNAGTYFGFVSCAIPPKNPLSWHDDVWPTLARAILDWPVNIQEGELLQEMEEEYRQANRARYPKSISELMELATQRRDALRNDIENTSPEKLPLSKGMELIEAQNIVQYLWTAMTFFSDLSIPPFPEPTQPEPFRTLTAINTVIGLCQARLKSGQTTKTPHLESDDAIVKETRRGRPSKPDEEKKKEIKLYLDYKASPLTKKEFIRERKLDNSEKRALERGRKAYEAQQKKVGNNSK